MKLSELRHKCQELGLSVIPHRHTKQGKPVYTVHSYRRALAEYTWQSVHNSLPSPVIRFLMYFDSPQLCKHLSFDELLNIEDWHNKIVEEKYRGVRALLVFQNHNDRQVMRFYNPRKMSDLSYYAQMFKCPSQAWVAYTPPSYIESFILDGELVWSSQEAYQRGLELASNIPALNDTFQTPEALLYSIISQDMNSDLIPFFKEKLIEFTAFDVLFYENTRLTELSLLTRKQVLSKLMSFAFPSCDVISVAPYYTAVTDEFEWFLDNIAHGGLEGMVVKEADGTYKIGSRAGWLAYKHERFNTYDVVYMGWEDDRVNFGAFYRQGPEIEFVRFCSLSVNKYKELEQMYGHLRDKASAPDTEAVIEVKARSNIVNNRFLGLCKVEIVRPRPDKSPEDCVYGPEDLI